MKRLIPLFTAILASCAPDAPTERYGFITRLGADTISVERVSRRGNTITSDEVDRFPRVRQRHTEIELRPDGGIEHLVMDIHTPSEPENQRDRHVVVDVTNDATHITKRDASGTVTRDFKTPGTLTMAHVPQMYSLYEIYFSAAMRQLAAKRAGDTVRFHQVYIDREFDRFSLHGGTVRKKTDSTAEIWHDWLAGVGEAKLDSAHHLLHYSGARTTYKVDVERVDTVPDLQAIGARYAAVETKNGGVKQLSVRDTARATIGSATFSIDYGRPLMRGRTLLGDVIPFDYVWRTGANAATQFTTSAPIALAGITMPAGTYTLWTVPHKARTDLIVNKQTGQWGTSYDEKQDLGSARMASDSVATPVEAFTISISAVDEHHGTLIMEWGRFRWTAPIVVLGATSR